ncbi:phosphorylase family protein [Lutispora thermophila]|uniref:Uridine phosphorylase n=1 Tax=Lutispora thermophila DSM 19022 TaxID=1122184 RepID=A0A1M6FXJ8_9FIRM|nr:hypothetical protein [Lutispora thermophila]SHJ02360.1 Phosphorylase superfamily protein [Lutispora thermophila DSM 19022]
MYESIKKEVMIEKHFGCSINDIAKSVIISPIWPLSGFMERAERIIKEFKGWYKGVTMLYKGKSVTAISSGIGAPMTGDCVMALGYSECQNILFSGSAGAINDKLNFGDILVCNDAVIGEGFSRYHSDDICRDCFGNVVSGSSDLANVIFQKAVIAAHSLGVSAHRGRVFSIDSILGENKRSFDFMIKRGCDAVEMEVSAVFTASQAIGRNAAALITISDLPLRQRSLFEGIGEDDHKQYKDTALMLPEILLETATSI